jgi:hypothetical protein
VIPMSFDMSRATLAPRAEVTRFAVLHNGVAIPGAEHATRQAALVAAWQLAKTCGAAIECFAVREVRS